MILAPNSIKKQWTLFKELVAIVSIFMTAKPQLFLSILRCKSSSEALLSNRFQAGLLSQAVCTSVILCSNPAAVDWWKIWTWKKIESLYVCVRQLKRLENYFCWRVWLAWIIRIAHTVSMISDTYSIILLSGNARFRILDNIIYWCH